MVRAWGLPFALLTDFFTVIKWLVMPEKKNQTSCLAREEAQTSKWTNVDQITVSTDGLKKKKKKIFSQSEWVLVVNDCKVLMKDKLMSETEAVGIYCSAASTCDPRLSLTLHGHDNHHSANARGRRQACPCNKQWSSVIWRPQLPWREPAQINTVDKLNKRTTITWIILGTYQKLTTYPQSLY